MGPRAADLVRRCQAEVPPGGGEHPLRCAHEVDHDHPVSYFGLSPTQVIDHALKRGHQVGREHGEQHRAIVGEDLASQKTGSMYRDHGFPGPGASHHLCGAFGARFHRPLLLRMQEHRPVLGRTHDGGLQGLWRGGEVHFACVGGGVERGRVVHHRFRVRDCVFVVSLQLSELRVRRETEQDIRHLGTHELCELDDLVLVGDPTKDPSRGGANAEPREHPRPIPAEGSHQAARWRGILGRGGSGDHPQHPAYPGDSVLLGPRCALVRRAQVQQHDRFSIDVAEHPIGAVEYLELAELGVNQTA